MKGKQNTKSGKRKFIANSNTQLMEQDSTDIDTDTGTLSHIESSVVRNKMITADDLNPQNMHTPTQSQSIPNRSCGDDGHYQESLFSAGARPKTNSSCSLGLTSSVMVADQTGKNKTNQKVSPDIPIIHGRAWNEQGISDLANLKRSVADIMSSIRDMTDRVPRRSDNRSEHLHKNKTPPLPISSVGISNTTRKRQRVRSRTSVPENLSSSSEESHADSNLTSMGDSNSIGVGRSRNPNSHFKTHVKLPIFTGKESWKVWYNRFNTVASRLGWNKDERLDEMLPRLQGQAGEFVFDQLSPESRENYRSLIYELETRFRVIETPKSFGSRFSKCNQKSGESAEEYAAELKRLYNKAYSNRDSETRREDLLRRFLDGLQNENASFQVEYIREPHSIDEAVYEIANFLQSKHYHSADKRHDNHKSRYATREVHIHESDTDIDLKSVVGSVEQTSSSEEHVARVADYGHNSKKSWPAKNDNSKSDKARNISMPSHSKNSGSDLRNVLTSLSQIEERLSKIELASRSEAVAKPPNDYSCYRCGERGHFIRDCTMSSNVNTVKNNSQTTTSGQATN